MTPSILLYFGVYQHLRKVQALNYSYIYLAFPINTATLNSLSFAYHYQLRFYFSLPSLCSRRTQPPRPALFILSGCFPRFQGRRLKGAKRCLDALEIPMNVAAENISSLRIDIEVPFNYLKISLVFLLLRILFNIFASTSRI